MGDYNSLFKQHTECNIHTITLIRDSILASSQKLQEKLALLEEMEHLFNDMLINAESLVVFFNEIDEHFTHSNEEIENFAKWLNKIKDSANNIDKLSNQAINIIRKQRNKTLFFFFCLIAIVRQHSLITIFIRHRFNTTNNLCKHLVSKRRQ